MDNLIGFQVARLRRTSPSSSACWRQQGLNLTRSTKKQATKYRSFAARQTEASLEPDSRDEKQNFFLPVTNVRCRTVYPFTFFS
jgi:hypothetical protein